MFSSVCIALILLFIQSISGQYAQNDGVIIGSSVGGILGLVNFLFEEKMFSINQL